MNLGSVSIKWLPDWASTAYRLLLGNCTLGLAVRITTSLNASALLLSTWFWETSSLSLTCKLFAAVISPSCCCDVLPSTISIASLLAICSLWPIDWLSSCCLPAPLIWSTCCWSLVALETCASWVWFNCWFWAPLGPLAWLACSILPVTLMPSLEATLLFELTCVFSSNANEPKDKPLVISGAGK